MCVLSVRAPPRRRDPPAPPPAAAEGENTDSSPRRGGLRESPPIACNCVSLVGMHLLRRRASGGTRRAEGSRSPPPAIAPGWRIARARQASLRPLPLQTPRAPLNCSAPGRPTRPCRRRWRPSVPCATSGPTSRPSSAPRPRRGRPRRAPDCVLGCVCRAGELSAGSIAQRTANAAHRARRARAQTRRKHAHTHTHKPSAPRRGADRHSCVVKG